MADTVENKKYLINIESNLAKYAEEAANAKKKVDELKTSNDELKKSGKATEAEIEANNAALRNAQKEYNAAKKLVDLQTQANTSNVNSRKQLAAIVEIEQKRLGALANQYTINSKGQRVLSDEYVKASKSLADAKQAIINYDLAQKDGRTNVGRYGESVKSAFSDIGSSILGFTTITGAAVLALGKLKDAFLETEKGGMVLSQFVNSAKTMWQGLINGDNVKDIYKNAKASEETSKKAAELRIKERTDMKEIAQLETDIKLLRLDAAKAGLTESQQLEILNKAEEKENQLISIKIANKQEELGVVNEFLTQRPKDTALLDQQAQLEADIITLQGENSLRLANSIANLTEKQIEAAKKRKEIRDKEMEDLEKLKIKNSEEALNQQNEIQGIIDTVRAKTAIRTTELRGLEEYNKKTEGWIKSRAALSEWEKNKYIADRQASANALSAMSETVGTQTEAGKAFAVAAATINTYTAASQALADPTIPSTLARVAMMTTILLTGFNNVRNILKVDTSGKGGQSIQTPSAITSAPATQRILAPQVGSSILNQPVTNQVVNNSMTGLTADDVRAIVSSLPAPKVSVVDINERIASKSKVDVRANI